MKYKDRVYGEFEITEPVILELIESAPLQRLKGVDQGGYRPLWVKPDVEVGQYDHSRFAHSVGVYLLLHRFNASIEEQISGLIHDVSHSAFSHCIDYILDSGSEKDHNHQDNVSDEYIRDTEIPMILKKHGFDPEFIIEEKNFPLREKNLPDLCADRIDYSLKTAVINGEMDEKDKRYILDSLIAKDEDWVFRDFESAKKYAELFININTVYYSGFSSAVMFRVVGDCIRHALQSEYISENDLYTTDSLVIEKVKRYLDKDMKLKMFFDRMNNKVKVSNDPDSFEASVFCKSRVVDPLFMERKEIKRVSQVDSDLGEVIKREMEPKQYFLKFEDSTGSVL